MNKEIIPYLKSYWVVPNLFMAGRYPYSDDPSQAKAVNSWLISNKFTYFLDLTESREYGLEPYIPALIKRVPSECITHKRMSIPDMGVPSKQRMIQILDDIDNAINDSQRVYMHCHAGVGRTGTVVGCYLVRHGMDGYAALEQIADWRKNIISSWLRSPETEGQRTMVQNWSE